jgi:hypothetical protein
MKINNVFKIRTFLSMLIVILISSLFLLSSCGGSEESSGVAKIDFKKGYGAVTLDLLDNRPPERLLVGDDLMISVKLNNFGAYDVTNGQVNIERLDRKYIDLFEPSKKFPQTGFTFEGQGISNSEGDVEFIDFFGLIRDIKEGVDFDEARFDVKVEYDTTNQLLYTVCLPAQGYNVIDSGCEKKANQKNSPIRLSGGQGSALSVDSIDLMPSGLSNPTVRFLISLKNGGHGEVGKVRIIKASLGGNQMECFFRKTDTMEYVFEDNQAEIFCEADVLSTNSYSTPLFLEYFYHYSIIETNNFQIYPRGK